MVKTLMKPMYLMSYLFLFLIFIPSCLTGYYIYLLTEILVISLYAESTNLLLGYTGLLSFGQAAFFGGGAYIVSLLLKNTGTPLLVAILFSAGICAFLALVIGIFCIHLRAFYFAILTLSFSQIFYAIAYKWINLTGGDDGIVGIPRHTFLGIDLSSSIHYYYFVLLIVSLSIAALSLIIKSPFGEALQAIRDNPLKAKFSGLNISNYRLGSFVIAGFFAGASGAIFAPLEGIVTPDVLHLSKSAEPLLISILGGMYTISGPIIGTAVFILIKEWIMEVTEYWMFWYGLLLIFLIIYLPSGIMGFISEKIRTMKRSDK